MIEMFYWFSGALLLGTLLQMQLFCDIRNVVIIFCRCEDRLNGLRIGTRRIRS